MEFFYVLTVLAVNGCKLSLGNLHHNIVVHFNSYIPSIPTISLCITCDNIASTVSTHRLHLLTSRFFKQNSIRRPFHSSLYIKVSAALWVCFNTTSVLCPRLTLLDYVKAKDVTQASVLPTYCNIFLNLAAVLIHEAGELLVSSICFNSI